MTSRLILAGALAVAVAFSAAILLAVSDKRPRPEPSAPRASTGPDTIPTAGVPRDDANPESATIGIEFQDDDAGCLSPAQLETHPAIAAEIERLDPLLAGGPTIESYRFLKREALVTLAEQGDSAAMTVLGAMHVMRLRGLDESDAVSYLAYDDMDLRNESVSLPLSSEQIAEIEAARDWFYKAALHGRLGALNELSILYFWTGDGPVELGWIGAGEYEDLERPERNAIDPVNVYVRVVDRLAPEMATGPYGAILDDLVATFVPATDDQARIVKELADDFENDRKTAGLPPIGAAEYRGPSLEELRALVCESHLKDEPQ